MNKHDEELEKEKWQKWSEKIKDFIPAASNAGVVYSYKEFEKTEEPKEPIEKELSYERT